MRRPRPASSYLKKLWQVRLDILQVSVVGYLVLVATFFQQLIAARLLGPELFGRYAAVAAVISLIEVALIGRSSDLAMRYMGTSRAASAEGDIRRLRRQLFLSDARILSTAYMLLLVLAYFASLVSPLDWMLFAVLGLTIPVQIGYGANKCNLFMLKSVRPLGNFELAHSLFAIALNTVGIVLGGLIGYATSLAIAALLKNLMAYAFLQREWRREAAWKPSSAVSALPGLPTTEVWHPALGRDGVISVVRNLLVNGLSQLDIIILSLMMPAQAVGYYKVAKSLSSLPTKIAFPLWRFVNPRLMAALREGRSDQARSAIRTGTLALAPLTVAILVCAYIWGKDVISLLYGPAFGPAYLSFVILLIGAAVLNGFGGWLAIWTVSTGAQQFSLAVYSCALFMMLVLGITVGSLDIAAMAAVASACMCGAYLCFHVKAAKH